MRLIFMALAAVYMALSAPLAMEAAEPTVRAVIAQDQHSVEITAPEETAFFKKKKKMSECDGADMVYYSESYFLFYTGKERSLDGEMDSSSFGGSDVVL